MRHDLKVRWRIGTCCRSTNTRGYSTNVKNPSLGQSFIVKRYKQVKTDPFCWKFLARKSCGKSWKDCRRRLVQRCTFAHHLFRYSWIRYRRHEKNFVASQSRRAAAGSQFQHCLNIRRPCTKSYSCQKSISKRQHICWITTQRFFRILQKWLEKHNFPLGFWGDTPRRAQKRKRLLKSFRTIFEVFRFPRNLRVDQDPLASSLRHPIVVSKLDTNYVQSAVWWEKWTC